VTSIGRRLSEQRENLILAQAAPHIDEGEPVLSWVRSRRTSGRGEGLVFITPTRVVVHWTSRNEPASTFKWVDITGWGVVPNARGGPVLGIEGPQGTCTVQLRAVTKAMGERVGEFIEHFAAHAPFAREPMNLDHENAAFKPLGTVKVPPHHMTVADKLKRVGLTVLGATMVIGGILLTPLPGPWSLPIVIGGLAVLSQEYDWAKDAREWIRTKSKEVAAKFKARRSSKD
jgi:uncharacterized protein (TIGR02611 family)